APRPRLGAASALLRRRRHRARGPLHVLVADLRKIARLDVFFTFRERLLERRQRLAGARQRRGAGEEEVLDVGVVDAALLELRDRGAERLVGLADELGALLPLRQRLGEVAGEELVDPLQDRRERAAREALVLLVEQAERDQVRRLELEGEVLLAGLRRFLGEDAVHADHLERLLLQVVRLLGVEREDLEGDLRVG